VPNQKKKAAAAVGGGKACRGPPATQSVRLL
jgi:hypothetical protein